MRIEKCRGFLGPCGKDSDPLYTLTDPDGTGPQILLCTECGSGSSAMFKKVFAARPWTLEFTEIAVACIRGNL